MGVRWGVTKITTVDLNAAVMTTIKGQTNEHLNSDKLHLVRELPLSNAGLRLRRF